VQQGLFIALGYMKPGDFSWNAVGHAAISGALSGAATGLGAAASIAAKAGTLTSTAATYVKIASGALKAASAASTQLLDHGKITSWTSLAGAAIGGYAGAGSAIATAEANAVGVTSEGLKAANAAANAAHDLQTITNYITPWAQLTETYVRNDGKLTPTDWAGAVGQTLGNAVSSDTASPLQNAVNKIGVNLLVAGALSHYGKDAAQSYAENAIGQEVGQYLGDMLGGSLKGLFGKNEPRDQRSYDPNKRAFVDRNGNIAVIPTQTGADSYLGSAQSDGQRRDAYGNPIAPLQVADSGAITTDVAPGLLAGSGDANANQTPSVEAYKLKSGDSYWKIAQQQLGPDASNADIQRQVYALMELNPGLDPRTLQVNQTINLITPNSGTSISAGTLAAYGQSNADYQNYREVQAQQAMAQEAAALRAASATSGAGMLLSLGNQAGPGFLDYAGAAWHGWETGVNGFINKASNYLTNEMLAYDKGGFYNTKLGGALNDVGEWIGKETYTAINGDASQTDTAKFLNNAAGFVKYLTTERSLAETVQGATDFTKNVAAGVENWWNSNTGLQKTEQITNFLGGEAVPFVLTAGAGTAVKVTGELALEGTQLAGRMGTRILEEAFTGPVPGGLRAQIGAVGDLSGLGSAGALENVAGAKSAYSVAYETQLGAESYPGVSRARHFQEANENLLTAMKADPAFAQGMNDLGVNLTRTPTGLAPRTELGSKKWTPST
jgi:hypothetical protein